MTPVRDQFNAYATAKIHYDQDQKTNPHLQPPKPLDLKAMAQANGMSLYVKDPISKWQAANLDVAKSFIDERIDFLSFAYRSANSFQLNQPMVSETGPRFSADGSKLLPGDVFLFWKTEDQAEYTPKFSDQGEREKSSSSGNNSRPASWRATKQSGWRRRSARRKNRSRKH